MPAFRFATYMACIYAASISINTQTTDLLRLGHKNMNQHYKQRIQQTCFIKNQTIKPGLWARFDKSGVSTHRNEQSISTIIFL